jgi:hypothetical protein
MTSVTTGATFGTSVTTGGEESVNGFAAALAVGGGLNDATIWVVSNDKNGVTTTGASTVFTPTTTSKGFTGGTPPTFQDLSLAFGVVLGLSTSDSSTTPIAFTRGIMAKTDGIWSDSLGVYGSDGGHIVFLGGNVQYYRNLGTGQNGELIGTDGAKTFDIKRTLKSGSTTRKFAEEGTATGAASTTAPGMGT